MTSGTDSLSFPMLSKSQITTNAHGIPHTTRKNNNDTFPSSKPDIHKSRPPITNAIDVWALGVTLYCFIFGRCPFIADTEFELFFRVIPYQPLQFPGDIQITNDLKDLLMRLLEKDPLKRITLDEVKVGNQRFWCERIFSFSFFLIN